MFSFTFSLKQNQDQSIMALVRRRMTSLLSKDVESREDPLKTAEEVLLRLYNVANSPLAVLDIERKEDLKVIQQLAQKHYGTDDYNRLYEMAKKVFDPENLSATNPIYLPFTVGSYLIGCSSETNLREISSDTVNRGCSLLCGDGLPPPLPKESWSFCNQTIIWAIHSQSSQGQRLSAENMKSTIFGSRRDRDESEAVSFHFALVNWMTSKDRAIIFVDYPSYETFPGFSRREKAKLLYNMGIGVVKIFSYNTNATEYNDLIGAPIRVQRIKQRSDPQDPSDVVHARAAAEARAAIRQADANSASLNIPGSLFKHPSNTSGLIASAMSMVSTSPRTFSWTQYAILCIILLVLSVGIMFGVRTLSGYRRTVRFGEQPHSKPRR